MSRILALAGSEFRIARRNRWVTVSAILMMVFALVLTGAGSAPSGALAADRLSVVVASLTSLAVYLVPLIALLLSFDAVAGEVERGTLPLLLTYPVTRAEVLAGKMIAHLAVLSLALLAGYGLAGAVAIWGDRAAMAGLPALWRLSWSSLLLGATFLGAGYALSSLSGRPSGAAGLSIALWVVMVVLYDLALLAMVVADQGGALTAQGLPALLLASPADAFRLFNLAASQATAAAAGLGAAAKTVPPVLALASLALWPVLAFGAALLAFRNVQP
ncbi:MAG: ABC transporter permease [Paracoccus sp. (in: a-proteobacteria)]